MDTNDKEATTSTVTISLPSQGLGGSRFCGNRLCFGLKVDSELSLPFDTCPLLSPKSKTSSVIELRGVESIPAG